MLEPTTSPPQPGDPEALGPYRLASRLGSGGSHGLDLRGGVAVSSQRLPQRLDPLQRVSGTLVFELPRTARPARLVLHDSLLSGGVSVRVSRS